MIINHLKYYYNIRIKQHYIVYKIKIIVTYKML